MSNAFDMVRKIRHLPGLKLTAIINPTQVTKRVKSAAQQMLRSGVLTNGYTSKSRMMAEQLLNDANREAPVSIQKWGVYITDAAILTKEARASISELLEAARMVEHTESTRNAQYINERYDNIQRNLKTTKVGRLSFSTYQPELNQQIGEAVASCRTPLMLEIHNELAAKLDGTEPFTINF